LTQIGGDKWEGGDTRELVTRIQISLLIIVNYRPFELRRRVFVSAGYIAWEIGSMLIPCHQKGAPAIKERDNVRNLQFTTFLLYTKVLVFLQK